MHEEKFYHAKHSEEFGIMRKCCSFLIVGVMFLFSPFYTYASTLLDFNESGASGTTWPEWTWYSGSENSGNGGTGCDGYAKPGWRNTAGAFLPSTFDWHPRACAKTTDGGNTSQAIIDASDRAPSTSTGASLKVYETSNGTNYYPSWWYIWDDNWGSLGLADSTTTRMDFYLKTTGLTDSGLPSNPSSWGTFHVGTYTCWPDGSSDTIPQGCPTESRAGHYYHYLNTAGGTDMWMHVQLDRHPTWQRDTDQPDNNPTSTFGYNYFEVLGKGFYAEVRRQQTTLSAYWLDEVRTWTQSQTENDNSITSLWVGYHTGTAKWEVGFADLSFGSVSNYNDNSKSTFEMRYSTAPITTANYASATLISPEYNAGTPANSFKRPNSWVTFAWTQFTLRAGVVSGNNKLYFAVKDISTTANGDGHNASSVAGGNDIKTIDYNIRPGSGTSDSIAPAAPTGLRVR